MHGLKRFMFGSRRRKQITIATVVLLVSAGAAIAAFILYTGLSGSGSAHVQNTSTVGALSVTGTNDPELLAGGNATAHYNIVNNDPGASHQITNATAVITSNPANCASFVTWAGSGLEGIIVPAGGTNSGDVTVSLSAATPVSCAGATVSFAISGTTTP
jgi:hypothetical protein